MTQFSNIKENRVGSGGPVCKAEDAFAEAAGKQGPEALGEQPNTQH